MVVACRSGWGASVGLPCLASGEGSCEGLRGLQACCGSSCSQLGWNSSKEAGYAAQNKDTQASVELISPHEVIIIVPADHGRLVISSRRPRRPALAHGVSSRAGDGSLSQLGHEGQVLLVHTCFVLSRLRGLAARWSVCSK